MRNNRIKVELYRAGQGHGDRCNLKVQRRKFGIKPKLVPRSIRVHRLVQLYFFRVQGSLVPSNISIGQLDANKGALCQYQTKGLVIQKNPRTIQKKSEKIRKIRKKSKDNFWDFQIQNPCTFFGGEQLLEFSVEILFYL